MGYIIISVYLFFFSDITGSWEEWWTYDGISGMNETLNFKKIN